MVIIMKQQTGLVGNIIKQPQHICNMVFVFVIINLCMFYGAFRDYVYLFVLFFSALLYVSFPHKRL